MFQKLYINKKILPNSHLRFHTTLMILVTEPVTSQMKQMVLRLGGFHTEMSFLGCIGHLMASSGLQELLEMIYASNTVVHMLTGKAIARAVRGHFIINAALNALVLSGKYHILSALSEDTDDIVDPTSVDEDSKANVFSGAAILLEKLIKGSVSVEEVCKNTVLASTETTIEIFKNCNALVAIYGNG